MLPRYLFEDLLDTGLPFTVAISDPRTGFTAEASGASLGTVRIGWPGGALEALPDVVLARINALLRAQAVSGRVRYAVRCAIPPSILITPRSPIEVDCDILLDEGDGGLLVTEVSLAGRTTLHLAAIEPDDVRETGRISRYTADRNVMEKLIIAGAAWSGRPMLPEIYAERFGTAALRRLRERPAPPNPVSAPVTLQAVVGGAKRDAKPVPGDARSLLRLLKGE